MGWFDGGGEKSLQQCPNCGEMKQMGDFDLFCSSCEKDMRADDTEEKVVSMDEWERDD